MDKAHRLFSMRNEMKLQRRPLSPFIHPSIQPIVGWFIVCVCIRFWHRSTNTFVSCASLVARLVTDIAVCNAGHATPQLYMSTYDNNNACAVVQCIVHD